MNSHWTWSLVFNGDTPILTSTWTFSPSSEIVTMRQTDGAAHKLKSRSFHKSAHLWVHSADFHPSVNCTWQYYQTIKSAVASEQFFLLNPLSQFHLQFNLAEFTLQSPNGFLSPQFFNSSSTTWDTLQHNLAFQWPDGLSTKYAMTFKMNPSKRLFISKVSF